MARSDQARQELQAAAREYAAWCLSGRPERGGGLEAHALKFAEAIMVEQLAPARRIEVR